MTKDQQFKDARQGKLYLRQQNKQKRKKEINSISKIDFKQMYKSIKKKKKKKERQIATK